MKFHRCTRHMSPHSVTKLTYAEPPFPHTGVPVKTSLLWRCTKCGEFHTSIVDGEFTLAQFLKMDTSDLERLMEGGSK